MDALQRTAGAASPSSRAGVVSRGRSLAHVAAGRARAHRRAGRAVDTRCSLSWDPPKFEAAKLSVRFVGGAQPAGAAGAPRRYTLTHNDLTGALTLSVGTEYNSEQVGGWYTRFLRDEVLAEWADGSLHVHCHVCGQGDWWLAPRQLRGFIFRREMPLVLDTVRFADREFLALHAELSDAPVLVHFHDRDAPVVECWGSLTDFPLMRGRPLSAASLRDAMLVSPQVDAAAARRGAPAAVADAAPQQQPPPPPHPSPPQLQPLRAPARVSDAPPGVPVAVPGSRFDTALLGSPAASRAVRQLAAVGARRGLTAVAAAAHDEVPVGVWVRRKKDAQ